MSEDSWRRARLIPASRVEEEPDRRAASVLLAVMAAVREFGRGLTQPLGAPRGTLRTYIDTPFPVAGQDWFPAGLIRVRRDQHTWTALVEVRTGPEPLDPARVRTCLDIAGEQGFDAVLTISNETSPGAGLHPVDLGSVDLGPVDRSPVEPRPALHHYAWGQLLAEAGMHQETRGVADPDQAWVLGELIRYLEDPGAGVLRFDVVQESMEPVTAPIARIQVPRVDDANTRIQVPIPDAANVAGVAANPVRPDDEVDASFAVHPVTPVSIDVSRIDAMPAARSVSLDLPFDRADSLDRPDPLAPSLQFSDTLESLEPLASLEALEPQEPCVSLEPAGARELPVRSAPPHPSRREIRLVRQLGDRDPAAASELPGTPEAGWYQDPGDAGRLRWFDGLAWSECTYPAQPALA